MMKINHNQMDELLMLECLTLAEKGAGYVSPNPMVGAVLVKNGTVIGRGYHKRFGGPHAEVNAISSAKKSVQDSTLYVNLEPCNYYGKTPPCTDLIINNKISNVVIGTLDPNPIVSGKGVKQLRRAGIEVQVGILEDECKKLNEIFNKFINSGLPFVALKIAQTLDGKIADPKGDSKWITNKISRQLVHYLRSRYDAVMVGANTVNKDNPSLTVRSVKGKNPIRLILDGNLTVNKNSKIFNDNEARNILFTSTKSARSNSFKVKQLLKKGIEIIEIQALRNNNLSLEQILKKLGSLGIASVLVEGGAKLFSEFMSEKLADKLLLFIAPKILGNGISGFKLLENQSISRHIKLSDINTNKLEDDILIEGYFRK